MINEEIIVFLATDKIVKGKFNKISRPNHQNVRTICLNMNDNTYNHITSDIITKFYLDKTEFTNKKKEYLFKHLIRKNILPDDILFEINEIL